MAHTKWL